jgi:uncharacterized protein (UPF0548 family)
MTWYFACISFANFKACSTCVAVSLPATTVCASALMSERAVTDPAAEHWAVTDPSFRRSEVSAVIGHGDEAWTRASREVLRWGVKTASGFVRSLTRAAPQQPWRALYPVPMLMQRVAKRRYLRALR